MNNELVTINSRKMDNTIHKSWKCELVKKSADYWLFFGKFEQDIYHSELGIIRRGTVSYEYYWTQKWFNIFLFYEPEGQFKFYYCNINQPPKFENNILDYVDLDIDILVENDLSYRVLDRTEFESNAKLYQYGDEIINKVEQTIYEIKNMIELKHFPFRTKN